MREFARLVEIVATLRAPGGCPWDREQTIDSLKPYVLEETYEVARGHRPPRPRVAPRGARAISSSRPCSSRSSRPKPGHFTVADALTGIADKLVRRHPHVFAARGRRRAHRSAGEVVTRWEQIKAQERGAAATPKTLLGGVPAALPALLRAYQIGLRARSVGFDWSRPADVVDKIQEEVDELREVVANGPAAEPASGSRRRWATCSSPSRICPPARDRARDRAAQGERQVHEAIRDDGTSRRAKRPNDERHEPGGAGTGWQQAKSGQPAS